MMKIVINGRVLLLPINGIPRYVTEIIHYFDEHPLNDMNIEVVIPEGCNPKLKLKNIRYVSLPKRVAWDYTSAENYARKQGALYINMANKGTLYQKSIIAIHDIRPISYDPMPNNLSSFMNYIKFKVSFILACKNARHLVTVSEFCKQEIMKYGKRNSEDITIIGNGWDHINRIKEDISVFDEFPDIAPNKYYLSVSSIAPHKNFEWIVMNSKNNTDSQFVVVGKTDAALWSDDTGFFKNNVVYLGHQSDERLKALLLNCKALIYPSLYEGFGIPPIEASGLGAKVIVSDIPVIREIMGEHAIYIDPLRTDYDIDSLLNNVSKDDVSWLETYTWEKQGEKWVRLIRKLSKSKKRTL